MKPKENEQGDVIYIWCKKRFKNADANIKLQGPGYIFLEDLESSKILAFKRPLFEGEVGLPVGVTSVQDEADLKKIELHEKKDQVNKEVPAPKPETLQKFRELMIEKGFKLNKNA